MTRPIPQRSAAMLASLLVVAILGGCNPARNNSNTANGAGAAASAGAGAGAGAGASGGTTASTAPGGSTGTAAGSGGTALHATGALSVMAFGYETGDEIAKTRVNLFKKANPDVKLTFDEGGFDEQAFLSSVASGDAPDLVYLDRTKVGTYAARGAIQPMTDCVAQAGIDMQGFRPSAAAQSTLNGTVFAIPEFFNTRLMIVNETAVKDAGLTLDQLKTSDWTALLQANQAMTKKSGTKLTRIGFDPKVPDFLPLWAKANGVSMMSDDGKESLLDDPKIAEALTFAKQLYDADGGKAAVDSFSQSWDFFGAKNQYAKDQLGAMPMEQWYINVLAENSPDATVAFQPFLARDGTPLTFADGNAWAIPKGAKNPTAACAFVATMTSTDTWVAAAQARADARAKDKKPYTGTFTGNIAADQKIFGSIYKPSGNQAFDDGVRTVLDLQEHAFALPASPAAAEFDKAWRDAVDRTLKEGVDPTQSLAEADQDAQNALDQAAQP